MLQDMTMSGQTERWAKVLLGSEAVLLDDVKYVMAYRDGISEGGPMREYTVPSGEVYVGERGILFLGIEAILASDYPVSRRFVPWASVGMIEAHGA
jgi:hypothetical protein